MKKIKLPKYTDDCPFNPLVGENKAVALSIAKKIRAGLPKVINTEHNCVDYEDEWAKEVWEDFAKLLTKQEMKWLDENPAWVRYCIFSYCKLPQKIMADVGRELLCTMIKW